MKKFAKKYGTRFLVGFLIHLLFKVTSDPTPNHFWVWDERNKVYFIFIISLVIGIWEIKDIIIKRYFDRFPSRKTSSRHLIRLFIILTLVTLPIVIMASYFSTYHLKVWLECPIVVDQESELLRDTILGQILVWSIISATFFKIYYEYSKEAEHEKALIQKELLQSQYESLKNQIKPHFLFNSFSVLTTLIHQNPDLASDFVAQLSKNFRYILENKDNDMVSLDKEIQFLDSYLFLLKIRHEDSISVTFTIDLETSDFYVPTLSLQMLIENATKHNNFSKEEPLMINIYNEGKDYLVVENVLNEKKSRVKSTRIGLENIKNRYELQTERNIVMERSASKFVVKLPILSQLQPI
ncbi:histidine kinase [Fulvivirgaceae bacterium BMA10]|uniref:Histidine kinase n=1 Tax=Splendidivirga corallicola TaxID=3051826 RepID=A0ABT8KKS1_9BACT|nr:histidine kinase [Fulvivirgaceae bacterium BMA10]